MSREVRAASLTGFLGRLAGNWEKAGGEVTIAEAADGLFPSHHGLEDVAVLGSHRIEFSVAPSVDDPALTQAVELGDRLACGLDLRKGLEVPAIGGLSDLEVSPEVLDAFAHAHPAAALAATAIGFEAEDREVPRVIDDRLDPEDAPLVVHLDPVMAEAVLDPAAVGTVLAAVL
jgi:hypothetical protein